MTISINIEESILSVRTLAGKITYIKWGKEDTIGNLRVFIINHFETFIGDFDQINYRIDLVYTLFGELYQLKDSELLVDVCYVSSIFLVVNKKKWKMLDWVKKQEKKLDIQGLTHNVNAVDYIEENIGKFKYFWKMLIENENYIWENLFLFPMQHI